MFSTYSYLETPTVPQPPVPSGTLGVVNPTLSTVSTSSIAGKMQGEYIISEMDAKHSVAQYAPIVESIPCQVSCAEKFLPKGTLVLFSSLKPTLNSIHARSNTFPRSRIGEPIATTAATFNTAKSVEEYKDSPKILFPLAESTEITKAKSQYIAVAVQNVSDVFVDSNNPSFDFKPGDPVYARRRSNGTYFICHHGGDFYLGTSILHQAHNESLPTSLRAHSIQVALMPRKL